MSTTSCGKTKNANRIPEHKAFKSIFSRLPQISGLNFDKTVQTYQVGVRKEQRELLIED